MAHGHVERRNWKHPFVDEMDRIKGRVGVYPGQLVSPGFVTRYTTDRRMLVIAALTKLLRQSEMANIRKDGHGRVWVAGCSQSNTNPILH